MQNVLWGFLTRWALEVGGFVSLLAGAYMSAPPAHQAAIEAIFTGQGGSLPVNAVIGLVLYTWGRFWAFRATVQPQIVTPDGTKVVPKTGSAVEAQIKDVARDARPQSLQPTIWEKLTSAFGR